MEYLTRWRMMLAGNGLQTTGDIISAIALSLGYESESAFGKAFEESWDIRPGNLCAASILRRNYSLVGATADSCLGAVGGSVVAQCPNSAAAAISLKLRPLHTACP